MGKINPALAGPRLTDPACAEHDPELWWGEDPAATLLALHICQECPAQRDCLTHALEQPEIEGVWGGTLPASRQRMRAERQAAA